MSRKVYIDVKARLILTMDEGVTVTEVLENMDYSFVSQNDEAYVLDSEIQDWEVTDSK
jgi:hypothetical protein